METLKIFKNVLGYTEMYYFEEEKKYAVKIHSDIALVNGLEFFNYKSEAIATFQFNVAWLENNK